MGITLSKICLPLAIGASVLLAGSGCSSFPREFRAAAGRPAPTVDITGPWEGEWKSAENSHRGKLMCLVSKRGEGTYDARFRAHYWGLFRYSYNVPLYGNSRGNTFQFIGEVDLGRLAGGIYRFNGKATPGRFFSTYEARSDFGTFEMARPGAEAHGGDARAPAVLDAR